MAGAIELARRHRLHTIAAREPPAWWSRRLPPGAQQFEQMRRQHYVAVSAALALLHAYDHAPAVGSPHLQGNYLSRTQTSVIVCAQLRPGLGPRPGIQAARH